MYPNERRIAALRLVAKLDQDIAAADAIARDRRQTKRVRRLAEAYASNFRRTLRHAERVLAKIE